MSKKFNVQAIVDERKNELDHSPLFHAEKPASTVNDASTSKRPRKDKVTPQPMMQSPLTSPEPQQPAQQASKKPYVRRTFDFYEEQIAYLKQESLREQLDGEEGSMNAMVREAIDDWIKKRTSTK
jgi:hypothetical protein